MSKPLQVVERQPARVLARRPKMVQAELAGSHTHRAFDGRRVHIWRRGDVYIARGRFERRYFGESLGTNELEAATRLRTILGDLDVGNFVPPTARIQQTLTRSYHTRRTVHDIVNKFLSDKARTLGQQTVRNYRSRLTPLLEFADLGHVRKRWPLVTTIDREFALQFRQFVAARRVSRNGRAASLAHPISPGQAYNVLDSTRTLFNWAKHPKIGLVNPSYVNPFENDIVGSRPSKDPLRASVFPLARRIQLVSNFDEWQLPHLALSMVLPLRPEDFAGLLIRDIDFVRREIKFGNRFHGRDFNKGRVSFVAPIPAEIALLLRICRGHRDDGPLLRRRAVVLGKRLPKLDANDAGDVDRHLADSFRHASPVDLATANDQKRLVRATIREMGGVSVGHLRKEFLTASQQLWPHGTHRFYDLKGSISTDMNLAGVSLFVQHYLTGHTTRGILKEYVSLNPASEMQKYFTGIQPLLDAMMRRAIDLGFSFAAATSEATE